MAQSGHAIAQFCLEQPELLKEWNNNYLISLSLDSEKKLEKFLIKLERLGINVSSFYEPDIGYELTSIAFIETEKTQKLTNKLRLALN